MQASMAVHSFNEGPALERLILSSLHASDLISEWVVLDHRSNDDTQAILDELEPVLAAHGIPLRRLFEERDLSRELTFAHVRDRTVQECRSDIVALMDADFVLGEAFRDTLWGAVLAFRAKPRLAAIKHRIPILWDHVQTDADGRVTDHGRLFLHGYSHRILRRKAVRYTQVGNDGRWEKPRFPGMSHSEVMNEDGRVLVSLNIKPAERIERRATMTEFMRAATKGEIKGSWHEHAPAALPKQPEYDFRSDRISPVLNLANLDLRA